MTKRPRKKRAEYRIPNPKEIECLSCGNLVPVVRTEITKKSVFFCSADPCPKCGKRDTALMYYRKKEDNDRMGMMINDIVELTK